MTYQQISEENLLILKNNAALGIRDQKVWNEITPEEIPEDIEFVLFPFYIVGKGSNIYRFEEGLKDAINTGLPISQLIRGVGTSNGFFKIYQKFIPLQT